MLTECENSYTEGSRRHWSRTVRIDGKFSHTEKWCVECKCWRKVEWIGRERFCEICEALQEYKSQFYSNPEEFDAYEQEWWIAFPPSLKYYPVRCRCGMGWDSVNKNITRCDKCWALMQETEESLR